MKSIYEYLVDKSNDLYNAEFNKNSKFWIHALENMIISSKSYKIGYSRDGKNWSESNEIKLNKNEYIFLFIEKDVLFSFEKTPNFKGKFEVGGNILYLIKKNPKNQEKLHDSEFENLFKDSDIVSAGELDLSHCITSKRCFASMFSGCKYLAAAPELPADRLSSYCYAFMFNACTSLKKAPNLPANNLFDHCYYSMFSRCSSLVKIPNLPANFIYEGAYKAMFWKCSKIEKIEIMAERTETRGEGMDSMFDECTNLKEVKIHIKPKDEMNPPNLSNLCSGWLSNTKGGIVWVEPGTNIEQLQSVTPDSWTIKTY